MSSWKTILVHKLPVHASSAASMWVVFSFITKELAAPHCNSYFIREHIWES